MTALFPRTASGSLVGFMLGAWREFAVPMTIECWCDCQFCIQ
jgi:hypothetical protein